MHTTVKGGAFFVVSLMEESEKANNVMQLYMNDIKR
jgi:hypothetical protein